MEPLAQQDRQVDPSWEYYHALYHLVAHWSACVALFVYVLTAGMILAIQQQPFTKWPCYLAIGIPGLMLLYFLTRMWRFGELVNEKLPPTYFRRHGNVHPYNIIAGLCLAGGIMLIE